ncbi:MAG: septum formation family protein, partial [Acidimicrobiales bacterium]
LLGGLVLLVIVVGAATLANRARRGTPLDGLRRGDCFNLTDGLFGQKAERVRCSAGHTDEVAGVLLLPGGRGAGYPGSAGILELGQRSCPAQVTEFYGSKPPAAAETFVSGPDRAAWKGGRRSVVCSLRQPSAARRTGSYRDG